MHPAGHIQNSQEYTQQIIASNNPPANTTATATAAYTGQYISQYYETPTPSTYSPVPNTSPAILAQTPSSGPAYAYITAQTPNTNTPPPDYVTPYYLPFTAQYSLIQVAPVSQQSISQTHSPLQPILINQQCNTNNNSPYYNQYNKENQKPHKSYKYQNNRKNPRNRNSYNNHGNNKKYNYPQQQQQQQQIDIDSIECSQSSQGSHYSQPQQQQQQYIQEAQPIMYRDYFENPTNNNYYNTATYETSQTEHYMQQVLPCNEITNYGYYSTQQQTEYCYNDSFNEQNENNNSNNENNNYLNINEDDEKLTCRVCRGKKKCFCYFIKVGYHKFPSYVDYAEHQFKQWKSNVTKARRM